MFRLYFIFRRDETRRGKHTECVDGLLKQTLGNARYRTLRKGTGSAVPAHSGRKKRSLPFIFPRDDGKMIFGLFVWEGGCCQPIKAGWFARRLDIHTQEKRRKAKEMDTKQEG